MVEYFERRAYGKYIDASRLFLYKATRDLLHWTGDTGAYLRSTIGALALFGDPPEEYWPYKVTNFDIEPSAFYYAFANDFRAISYFRLDDTSTKPPALLTKIKAGLAAGLPCVFGSPSTARSHRPRRPAGSRSRGTGRKCWAAMRCSWSATTTS
jgi:C1A family cysteine protease